MRFRTFSNSRPPAPRGVPTEMACLLSIALLLLSGGCGSASSNSQQASVEQPNPVEEFEWGMTRLRRALDNFRPDTADGLRSKRSVEYELTPPDSENPNYTAQVTILSKTSFLHAKPETKRETPPKPTEVPELDDPLALEDEFSELIDFEKAGPGAPAVPAPNIDTRSLETQKVYDMVYLDKKWQLEKQPELKHEQLWFDYAFE